MSDNDNLCQGCGAPVCAGVLLCPACGDVTVDPFDKFFDQLLASVKDARIQRKEE